MSRASRPASVATIANGTTNSRPTAAVTPNASSSLCLPSQGRRSSQPNAGHNAMAITAAHTTAGMKVRIVHSATATSAV